MRKLCVTSLALLLAASVALAQQKATKQQHPALPHLFNRLSLTAEQKTKITTTQAETQAAISKLRVAERETVLAVLTSEQKVKLLSLLEAESGVKIQQGGK